MGAVEDAAVLDLFAGTGSLGLECLSRGASRAVFVDKAPQAIKAINRNVEACRLEEKSTVYKRDVLRGLGFLKPFSPAFDLVFLDPPYEKDFAERALQLVDHAGKIQEGALVIVEHSSREMLPERIARLALDDRRDYGKTLVSFYRPVILNTSYS